MARPLGKNLAVAAGATAFAVLLGLVGGALGTEPDLRLAASADGYATTDGGAPGDGTRFELVAGGLRGGAAVTYLKFDVTDRRADRQPASAEITLTRRAGQLPPALELSQVPATSWQEDKLDRRTAPRLGSVVAAARPAPTDKSVRFDVSKAIKGRGTYAFAVTAPGGGVADFVDADAVRPSQRKSAPTLKVSWKGGKAPGVPRPGDVPGVPRPGQVPGVPSFPRPSLPPPPDLPTALPTAVPTTGRPTPASPSPSSTGRPTATPTGRPTAPPTTPPSATPTTSPTTSPSATPTARPTGTPTTGPTRPPATPTARPTVPGPGTPTSGPTLPGPGTPTDPDPTDPDPTDPTTPPDPPGDGECALGPKLVPTCGVLWGVAPGAHTNQPRDEALYEFEADTGRTQAIYHAYHRGTELFPTAMEREIARDPAKPRLLFLNWKPTGASWAAIANGHRATDDYLDRLATHIRENFPEPFFFTVHHEPENDVRESAGSGYTAADYRAMFRYVINRLRTQGVTNLVSTMVHMAYVPWNTKPWFEDLYPGDDVVDWVAWDIYAYSDPGYGHGDFSELMNRTSSTAPDWPGFYNYAAARHPDKPFMLAEWGVWYSSRNPGHMAEFYDSVARQISLYPRLKAMVYFDTPADQSGRDSRVDRTAEGLAAYQRLGADPTFDVSVAAPPSPSP